MSSPLTITCAGCGKRLTHAQECMASNVCETCLTKHTHLAKLEAICPVCKNQKIGDRFGWFEVHEYGVPGEPIECQCNSERVTCAPCHGGGCDQCDGEGSLAVTHLQRIGGDE